MKTVNYLILGAALFFQSFAFGQNEVKQTCTVLDIQVKGKVMMSSTAAGNLTRHLMNKLNVYTISYDQDINYILKEEELKSYKLYRDEFENNLKRNVRIDTSLRGKKIEAIENIDETFENMDQAKRDKLVQKSSELSYACYSIQCLEKVGKTLKSDKMLSGYIERIKGNYIISFREFDIKTSKVTRTISREYKEIPEQVKNMVLITLQEMYHFDVNKSLRDFLTQPESRESTINNPDVKRLNHSGVRMGIVHVFGDNAEILKQSETVGGFDASPTMFQFGYQFETQYLNQGRVQGLFEFIPMVTGLEQGLILPSLTVLHGLRDNKSGIEFAFGPTFGFTTVSDGYYDEGNWKMKSEWTDTAANPYPIFSRLDSRGETKLTAGFLFGIGFSFKSGDLNIPVNLFTVMQKKNFRVGISFGFNAKGNSKK